jgi:hypothetical protein
MDGAIWKFTQSEYACLPRFVPAIDHETGAPIGLNQIIWSVDDAVYVVFYDRSDPTSGDPKQYEQPNPNDIALPDSVMYYGDEK